MEAQGPLQASSSGARLNRVTTKRSQLMRKLRAACVVGLLVVVPSAAFAQASITGIVKDTSVPCFRVSRSKRPARC